MSDITLLDKNKLYHKFKQSFQIMLLKLLKVTKTFKFLFRFSFTCCVRDFFKTLVKFTFTFAYTYF